MMPRDPGSQLGGGKIKNNDLSYLYFVATLRVMGGWNNLGMQKEPAESRRSFCQLYLVCVDWK